MKINSWIVILLGLTLPHLATAGNKKSFGGGGHAARAVHVGGGGRSFHAAPHFNGGQRSFRSSPMRSSSSFRGGSGMRSQGVAQHGLHAAHGLNAHQNLGGHGQGLHSGPGLHTSQGLRGQHFQNSRGLSSRGFGPGGFRHGNVAGLHAGARFGNHAWHGSQFRNYHQAFSGYHRQFHDRYWWHNHYNRFDYVGGGYYYWDAGYWYPAWGYEPAFVEYAYDGPIYSYNNLPPDQVIVNVQDELQDEGYYTGDVDGQLGAKTRDAIGAFQRDHGLEVTAAVDEPTVQALGLG